jgi:hypothetical protein
VAGFVAAFGDRKPWSRSGSQDVAVLARNLSSVPVHSQKARVTFMRTVNIFLYLLIGAGSLAGQTDLYVTNAGVNNLPGVVNVATNTIVNIFSSGWNSSFVAVNGRAHARTIQMFSITT